ncbi:TrmB family transcriptional regulator [Haloarchaeobius sp. HME9146]|uniref:TrmB family transcriptional regulator n=1 Tax=Haloarchaeobius sp. HME9146 TaxID=2978732 RepID=UPI0021BDF261|nr:helix-turn-helix domain-containing protein [Haloarchaeobius sp. HME9146]MCT9098343.1 TrmB family transcriptional regulator [Haloarchaeobius sp. HME9146]
MTDRHTDSPEELATEAVDLLKAFELTEYEAKCFTALCRIGQGTAKEVSEVAGVPQARVYDCMDSLQERGLADAQQSKPRRYRGTGPDEAVDTLERRVDEKLSRLGELLPQLGADAREEKGGEIWVTEGDAEVAERMARLVGAAETEVLLAVAVEDLLTDTLLDALRAASTRGVSVTVGSPAPAVRDTVSSDVTGATVVETWTWWESHPIRPGAMSSVLMVDGHSLLVSADAPTDLPGVRTHRAVWTDGDDAPLVSMMRPLLSQAIAGDETATI